MTSIYVPLTEACQRSTELDLFGQIWTDGTWWFINNAAGVVIGRGRSCREAVEDFLGPVEVNP